MSRLDAEHLANLAERHELDRLIKRTPVYREGPRWTWLCHCGDGPSAGNYRPTPTAAREAHEQHQRRHT